MGALLIATGVVALAAMVIWSICGPKRSNGVQRQEQARPDRQASKDSRNETQTPATTSEGHPSVSECEDARKKFRECRECWTLAIEVVGLLGLSAYAYITFQLWQEAQKQTVDSARAWVGYQQIPNSNLPIAIDRLEISPSLRVEWHYTIENFGNGPAIKVVPESLIPPSNDLEGVRGTAAFICDNGTKFATGTIPIEPPRQNPGRMGIVLFPHQTYTDNSMSPSRSDSPYASAWKGPAMPDLKWMFIMGCVAYLDQFKAPHWTRFVVQIGNGIDPVSMASPRMLYSLLNDTDETGEKKK